MLDMTFHKNRRDAFANLLPDGGMALLYAGDEKVESGDQTYLFSPDRGFYYLSGYQKPSSYYLMIKNENGYQDVLAVERLSARAQLFNGKMQCLDELKTTYHVTNVCYTDELLSVLAGHFYRQNYSVLCTASLPFSADTPPDRGTMFVRDLQARYPFLRVKNLYHELSALRTVKQPEEIEQHRRACTVTAMGVAAILKKLSPEMTEGQIEAYFDFVLKSNGCGHAFPTIAATGKNACTLHYHENDCKMEDGQLILFDLGARSGYYCADVSRTYPVNGSFTKHQKQLYKAVLKGLEAGIAMTKPGVRKNLIQLESKRVMAEELVKLGVIETPDDIQPYYKHASGHFIGLDTHDVGKDDSILQKDMMFTLEPGLYFEEEGIGIRIEDTILITEDGCEVLTNHIPKKVSEIEAMMAKKK